MWYLKDTNGAITYIPTNKPLTVGRTSGDLILKGQSISRTHASILIEPISQIQADKLISKCIVKDTGSKYGSYILHNDDATAIANEGASLNNLDKIRFGLENHVFTVYYVPIITATSVINDDVKTELTDIINTIDGVITTKNILLSTHLTVSKGCLTEKVTCALAAGIPIVDIKYWRDALSAVKVNKQLPDTLEYTPLISEGMIQKEMTLLSVNPCRSTLFNNLLFVFLKALQYNLYSRMVKAAGGKCHLYTKKPLREKDLCGANIIVLQPPDDSTQTENAHDATYESIRAALKRTERRMIPQSDITLAILHCSTRKYCNPKFDFSNLLSSSKKQSLQVNAQILEADSQDNFTAQNDMNVITSSEPMTSRSWTKSRNYIPETNVSIDNSEMISGTEVTAMASKFASKNKVYEANTNINNTEIIENSQKDKGKNVRLNDTSKKINPESQARSSSFNAVIPETENQSGIMENIISLDDDDDDDNNRCERNDISNNLRTRQSGLLSLSIKQKRERSVSSVDSLPESKKQRMTIAMKTLKDFKSSKTNEITREKLTTLSPEQFFFNVESDQCFSDDDKRHNVTNSIKPNKITSEPCPEIKEDPDINLDDDIKVLNVDPPRINVKTEDVSSNVENISPVRRLAHIKLNRSNDEFYRSVQHRTQEHLINVVALLRKVPSILKSKELPRKKIPQERILIRDMYVCNMI